MLILFLFSSRIWPHQDRIGVIELRLQSHTQLSSYYNVIDLLSVLHAVTSPREIGEGRQLEVRLK